MSDTTTTQPTVQLIGGPGAYCDPESDYCDIPTAAADSEPTKTPKSPAAH